MTIRFDPSPSNDNFLVLNQPVVQIRINRPGTIKRSVLPTDKRESDKNLILLIRQFGGRGKLEFKRDD
jgi:hypothetical protein